MANAEMQLVSRIVRTGDIQTAMNWGVSDADFRSNEPKSVWRYIAGYYAKNGTNGSVIGPNVFANLFPQLQLYDDHAMTTEALCYEVRRARIVAEAKEATIELVDNIELDPSAAIAILHKQMQNLLALGEGKNHDLSFADAMDKLMSRYSQVKNNQYAFARMPWPWQVMNDYTGGIQEDDFIILYGRPKSMKTWVLTSIMAWAYQNEKTAVIYTKEMTQENIYQRVAACIAQFPYQELRNGKLMPHDEVLLGELARMAKDKYTKANLICLDGRKVGPGGDTVAWLHSKVENYKPDIVFVDGMYLLSDSASGKKTADWQRVTNISRGLREMILHTKIPVVATMQANRAAAKHSDGNLDEIAYADAVAQDATIAIRTINVGEEINLVLAGSREFKLQGIKINGKPATDFSYISTLTTADIKAAEKEEQKADAKEKEEQKKKNRTPRTRTDETTDKDDKHMNFHMSTVG